MKGLRIQASIGLALLLAGTFAFFPFRDLMAQNTNRRALHWLEKGRTAAKVQDYGHAEEYLRWSIEKGGGEDATMALARVYAKMRRFEVASTLLENQRVFNTSYEATYLYARCLMAQGKYAKVQEIYPTLLSFCPSCEQSADLPTIISLVNRMRADSVTFDLGKMAFNGPQSDFAATAFEDGLLFVSARPNDLAVKKVSGLNGAELLDLYFTKPKGNNRWTRPQPYGQLNSDLNEGPLAWDDANQTIYLTRNEPRRGMAGTELSGLQIVAYKRSGNNWSALPNPIRPGTFTAHGHPTLDTNGDRLFFAAVASGSAQSDIFYCLRDGDTWSQPLPLSGPVNTRENELFPFIAGNGDLYFASEGHFGLGGLDVFVSRRLPNGQFAPPQNMGAPVNSSSDDFALLCSPLGDSGYVSSNRNAAMDDDNIYWFKRTWPQLDCRQALRNNYCFRFEDEAPSMALDTLPVAYEWDFGDGHRARGKVARHCYDGPGDYQVVLAVVDTVLKTVVVSKSAYTHSVRNLPQLMMSAPDTIEMGRELILTADASELSDCFIDRFYWETSGLKLQGDSIRLKASVLGPLKVRLGGTGIATEGTPNPCNTCVEQTIVVVDAPTMEEIIRRRTSDRLLASANEPRFETSPPTPASSDPPAIPGKPDEIRITTTDGTTLTLKTVKDSLGGNRVLAPNDQGSSLPQDALTSAEIKFLPSPQGGGSLEFRLPDGQVIVWEASPQDINISLKSALGVMPLTGWVGTNSPSRKRMDYNALQAIVSSPAGLRVSTVLFDFDSYALRSQAVADLSLVMAFLRENSTLGIKINAHTDDVGDAQYNLHLSDLRAQAVAAYFLKGGLDPQRIRSQGYGESSPAVPNVDASSRQQNRRVEFDFYNIQR